jgi:hypothetical protein
VRVGATDVISALKMRSYFAVIGPFSRAIRRSTFNRLSRELGNLFANEADISLPGDWIVQNPEGSATHGITIEAPVEFVWPWLTQMGCRRAGWYSYDWLDNAGIPSAHRIVSEWQELKEGDILPATPAGEFGFHVVEAKPPNFLILGLCVDRDSGRTLHPNIGKLPRNYSRTTWVFVLEPQTKDISRLVVRVRTDSADNNSGLRNKILMKQIHNFMEEKQIRNLKERAEQMYLAVQAKNDLFKDLGEFSINDSEGEFDSFSNVKRMQG